MELQREKHKRKSKGIGRGFGRERKEVVFGGDEEGKRYWSEGGWVAGVRQDGCQGVVEHDDALETELLPEIPMVRQDPVAQISRPLQAEKPTEGDANSAIRPVSRTI